MAQQFPQKQKHSHRPDVLSSCTNSFPEEKLCALPS